MSQRGEASDARFRRVAVIGVGLIGGSFALALKAAKDYPDLPVLLMTGYAAERQRAHNLDALIQDVISKPFTLLEIREAVRRMLGDEKSKTRGTVH